MKQSTAVKYIRAALFCVQKLRSNTAEAVGIHLNGNQFAQELMKAEYPWIYDDQKTLLNPLLKIVDRLDEGGTLAPMDFYNIMFVIYRFADLVETQYIVSYDDLQGFPIPDKEWLRGWEAE